MKKENIMNNKTIIIVGLCISYLIPSSNIDAKVMEVGISEKEASLTETTKQKDLGKSTIAESMNSKNTKFKFTESKLSDTKTANMRKKLSRLSTDERPSDSKIKIASSNYKSVMKNSDVLSEIQSLDMHRSKLSTQQISEILAKCNPEKLEILNLDDNNLTTIPQEVFTFSKLKWLKLARNKLNELPDDIGNLTQLTILKLDHNQLQDLPSTVENLTNILQLYLEYNKIKTVPTVIPSLSSLKVLHLEGNLLQTLPENMGDLTSLRSIFLMKNKIMKDDQQKLKKLFNEDQEVRVFF